jgi:hypothetical protein
MKDNDFLWIQNDWMAKEFDRLQVVHSPHYLTFKTALNIFMQLEGNLIVETGSMRVRDDPGGAYTLLLGAFCKRYGKRLITVDISPEVTNTCKEVTIDYVDYITYITQDSVAFLNTFNEPIDLLFLDSMDCPIEKQATANDAQRHNYDEFNAAKKSLHKHSVLLMDDNNFINGGKPWLTKNHLLTLPDWICLLDYAHSLWVKVK